MPFFQEDVRNLRGLYEFLLFKVILIKNQPGFIIRNVLEQFANDSRHDSASMMILTILSHGEDGHFYARDGDRINIEILLRQFNNTNCPKLAGKPKWFVIQVNI